MAVEKTAAAEGTVGELRFDPMAMLPFCGYNMADYFAHWLKIGARDKPPKIFYVNWFRKDRDGNYLWPGFGDNARVLAWIFRRCDGAAEATETPIGLVPAKGAIDMSGLDDVDVDALLKVDEDEVRAGLEQVREHLARFGDRLPDEIRNQLKALEGRLAA